VESQKNPLIDKDYPDCEDDKYGFKGGMVVKSNGTCHMFTAKNNRDPYIVKMTQCTD
jgi:hypothetical protein